MLYANSHANKAAVIDWVNSSLLVCLFLVSHIDFKTYFQIIFKMDEIRE